MSRARVPLTEASERNFAALRRAMARSRRFALYFLLADGPARAELRARLDKASGIDGVPPLRLFPEGSAGAHEISELLARTSRDPLSGAVIVDGDSLVAAEEPVLSLNVARDRLGQLVEGPLAIILSPQSEADFARMAPDLFDVRAATYEFETDEASAPAVPIGLPKSRSEVERLPDPDVLRSLEASAEPPLGSALADAWLRLAEGREEQDDFEGAIEAASEVLRLGRPLGYRAAVSRALRVQARAHIHAGRLADVEQALSEALSTADDDVARALSWREMSNLRVAQGHLDAALRILREEALPLVNRLRDDLLRALTMGAIADVLQRQGKMEASLRILREEELPVYERVGVIDMVAIRTAKVASILEARGELDEALRIWRQEVLPALERIGEVSLLAVGRAKVAKLLVQRAKPDDHAEAANLLRLAVHDAEALRMPESESMRALLEELDIT